MAKLVSKKLEKSMEKISDLADLLLKSDGHIDFEIDSIIISTKGPKKQFVNCHWVKRNGQWVKVCTPE